MYPIKSEIVEATDTVQYITSRGQENTDLNKT